MANGETRLVRIRPGRKGFKVKRYMYRGTRYDAERGWYRVGLALAMELEKFHQDHYDDESPKLFQVCTDEEAATIDEAESKKAEKAPATRPHQVAAVRTRRERARAGAVTTADLPANQNDDEDLEEEAVEMLDPDPEGAELADAPDEAEGVAHVGRVSKSTPPAAAGKPAKKRGGRKAGKSQPPAAE